MIAHSQLMEIRKRLDAATDAFAAEIAAGRGVDSLHPLHSDAVALLAEVERLHGVVTEYTAKVNHKLAELEGDMLGLDKENERLRSASDSALLERDACISLIARMAVRMGVPVGTAQLEAAGQVHNRVVVDLPSGQVSWDFLETEAHLFEGLPIYSGQVEDQSIRDVYTKVMNPGLDPVS